MYPFCPPCIFKLVVWKQANADYQYDVFEHQFHVFQVFAPLVKEEVEAIKRIGSFVAGVEANRDDFKLDKRLA